MSHSYQIDIDSSFRDRISYPDCGNFVIPINTSFSNSNNPFTARDPVLLGFPYDTGECYEATGPYSVDLPGFILQLSSGSLNNINAYVGSILQIDSGYYTILAYDHITKVAVTLEPYIGPGSYPIAPFEYTIRFEKPMPLPVSSTNYQNVLPINTPSVTQVKLGPEANTLTRELIIGKYIYFQPTLSTLYPWLKLFVSTLAPIDIINYVFQWSLIKDYDPVTKIVTLTIPLYTIMPAGTIYEILYYSYDNAQPLRYSGTEIFNNPRCCNISLANCQIPAYLPIVSRNSGYITDYPYVYIAFYSERERTYNQPLMSMSPLSDRALFKVPISPNTDILTTKYLTLGGGITSQTVYFKHNDTFRFELYLPNGQPLTFNPTIYAFFSGIYTYFNGLGFPIVSDPKSNVQATFNVSFS